MKTPPTRRQPRPFGKFLLLERIGIGSMTEVWRGKGFFAGGLERLVAIKHLLPHLMKDEAAMSALIDEANICVQLPHANIGQIYDLGHVGDTFYIAMEYIPGKDLRTLFRHARKERQPVPVPLACYCIAKACEGLDYVHRKKSATGVDLGIVHCGICPEDVLVSYEGEVKVIDFDDARTAEQGTRPRLGVIQGKAGYMSPEQSLGLPVDRRADMFALGVCLYELLTGERLFEGDGGQDSDAKALSALEKSRQAQVPPPSRLNPRIPEALEQVVLKALAREVDARYATAGELAAALQPFLRTEGGTFGRMDLSIYMKSTFASDLEQERQWQEEFASLKLPTGADSP